LVIPPVLARPDLEIGSEFIDRLQAATRTYKAKPHLQKLPVGEICTPETTLPFPLVYAEELRRLLGAKREVNDQDNIKQHSHTHKVL
jgi:hypothetical protein